MQIFSRLRDRTLSVPTLAELADEYLAESDLAYQAQEITASTRRGHKQAARMVTQDLGHLRPTEVTLDEAIAWRRRYKHRPSSWNHAYTCLRWCIHLSIRRGWLDGNPIEGMARLRHNRRDCRLMPEQIAAVLDELREQEEHARQRATRSAAGCLQLIVYTGGRSREIAELRWPGVYLDRRLIHCGLSKNGQQARYGLTDQAVELLERFAECRVSDVVFPGNRDDKPVVGLRTAWRAACEAAQTRMVIHGLRHTWVTEALAEAPLHEVALAIGHTSKWTTDRYGHLSTESIRPVVDRMSQRFAALDRRVS